MAGVCVRERMGTSKRKKKVVKNAFLSSKNHFTVHIYVDF